MRKRIDDTEDNPSYMTMADNLDLMITFKQIKDNCNKQMNIKDSDHYNKDDYAIYKLVDRFVPSKSIKLLLYALAWFGGGNDRFYMIGYYMLLSAGLTTDLVHPIDRNYTSFHYTNEAAEELDNLLVRVRKEDNGLLKVHKKMLQYLRG